MRIILVRHGETPANRDRLTLGRADPALSELGLRQAEAVAREVAARAPAEAVYTSPLLRARQTADAVGALLGLKPVVLDDLVEMDVGEMEGLTSQELRQRHPEFLAAWWSAAAGEAKMPGGESLADVQARTWRAIEAIRDQHPPEASVVAVSHNLALHTILCRALAMPLADFRRFQQDLASFTTLEIRGARMLVTNLNETCHLEVISDQ